MRTAVRQIGNSRGIIIPAALLAACDLSGEVDLYVQDKKLVVQAVCEPRAGWFAHFNQQAEMNTDWPDHPFLDEAGDEDWTW